MKKIFTLLMLSIFAVMNVNAEETTLWTGSYAVDWSSIWEDGGTVTAALKEQAAVGDVLHFSCERTAADYCQISATVDWTEISMGGGEESRGMIDFNGTSTIDFVLTETSMQLFNQKNLQVVGHGFNLLKISLEKAVPDTEEKVLWSGTHAVDWGTPWEEADEAEMKLKDFAAVGTPLRLYCERTDNADGGFCEACPAVNWANICTGGTDPNRGGTNFAGKVLLNYVLTDTSLQLLKEGKLGVVGHGFNLLKVTVVAPKSSTAINEVKGNQAAVSDRYYNLRGQVVAHPTKGLYIINGKKVLAK